tara:strand:- start:573 stop:1103 length:531 start_codon:yes stop_codon:yes gene_type:complete
MQRFGSIIKQINRRNNMDVEQFECSHKMSFASKEGNGKYSIYVTKDDGTDMTIYGEAIGAEGWGKGARLKIMAQPARQSKNGKWYQTAKSVELLGGEVNTSVPVPTASATKPIAQDNDAQWKEKYRLTMSNLMASALANSTGAAGIDFDAIDKIVRKILSAKLDEMDDDLPKDPPF